MDLLEPLYIDILISSNDITLDAGGLPVLVNNRASIAQDIVHMIRDSGLLVDIVGERNAMRRRRNMVEITLLVDDDERIVPGSTVIEEASPGEYWLTAETVDFGKLDFMLGVN